LYVSPHTQSNLSSDHKSDKESKQQIFIWNLNNISFVKQLVFYIIKLFAHIYMSAIAGKTAGPNGLTFFRKPMGTRGVT